MRTQNKGTRSSRFRITTIAIAVASSFAMTPAWAADSDIVDKGAQPIAYDISPANDGTNIAIGKNAKVFIGGGTQESMLSFGEDVSFTNLGFSMNIHSNTAAKQNLPSGIAVGTNTYARTASIQIGDHTLEKNKIAIGDTTADKLRQLGVAATTIGTNSYTGGGFATTIGSYNVQSSPYEANGNRDTLKNSTKNAFATVIGTLNSNESMTGTLSSGVANFLGGVANKVTNSNGAVVIGAGNTVKESSDYIDASGYTGHPDSVTALQQSFIDGLQNYSGGATLVLGGGNQAEYTQASQLIGVNNTLKGTSSSISQYNALNGYKNTATNVKQTYITGLENTVDNSLQVKVLGDNNTGTSIKNTSLIGTGNTVSSSQSDIVIGDYHTLSGGGNNVIIGSMETQDQPQAQQVTETYSVTANGVSQDISTEKVPVKTHKSDISDTVMIGHNADVTVNGGVALGANSVASTDKGVAGYDLSTGAASTETSVAWKSTAAAVSVGDVDHEVTRQITGVAAGLNDTDAVNVAQLKKAAAAATTTVATTDSNLTVAETPSGSHNYQVELNKKLTGMESAEFRADAAKTTISAGGVTIAKDSTTVSLKSNGLDNGGQTIKNVAAGENDTDAVNLLQLKNSVTKVESASQDYIDITTRKENAPTNTGATIYSVGLSVDAETAITNANHYLTADGINAQNQKITNVAPGTISATSTDAVNGSQLYQTNQAVQQNSDDISKLYNRSAELNRKIHRAGAHAAALAALHPLDFDENHRVSASLGLGQYHSSGAAALGIFVRPTENFMVSLGGSIASGSDVMGNLGVHYRFGGDSVRVNKTELTQQVSTLTAENRDLSAKLASSNSKLEAATSKIDSLMERIHAIEAKLNMK